MSDALTAVASRERARSLQTIALSLTDRLDRVLLERYDDAQACGVNTALSATRHHTRRLRMRGAPLGA